MIEIWGFIKLTPKMRLDDCQELRNEKLVYEKQVLLCNLLEGSLIGEEDIL